MPEKGIDTAAVLVIGDEILSGRTQDTNSNHIARVLAALGIDLKEVRVVGDVEGEIVAALNLNEATIPQLLEMLHEYSVNGVILSAKHAYFEHVEQAIRACELEGVEAWLIADFFKTQISRYVDDKLTVVVLANQASAEPGKIAEHVAEIYLSGNSKQ